MLKKIIEFFRRLFGIKEKEKLSLPEFKFKEFADEKHTIEGKVITHHVIPKEKINTFAFRKQQLIGKAFFKQNKLYRIEKFLGMNTTKFKYNVSHKTVS